MSNKKKHDKEQDVVYEQLGLNTLVQEADIVQVHEDQDAQVLAEEQASEETGVIVKHETENKLENGERLEISAKTAFQESKVALGRLPVWYLNALGSMTEEELDNFTRTYSGKLSMNEQIALNLLKKAKWGDKEAVDKFWNIQMKLLNKTNVVNQINVSVQKPDSVVTDLLDKITKNIQNGDAAQN